jgi:hypothetical protein
MGLLAQLSQPEDVKTVDKTHTNATSDATTAK